MTQDEAIIIKRKQEYYSSLADIDKKLKDISKGYKLGKKLGLTDDDLSPWSKLDSGIFSLDTKNIVITQCHYTIFRQKIQLNFP